MTAPALDMVCPINWLDPLNRGLVSRWLCVPGLMGGSTLIDLCRRNTGVLTNMDPATDWVGAAGSGLFGALDFDGSNDYVTCGDVPVSGLTELTVVARVWASGAVSNGRIITKNDVASFAINYGTQTTPQFLINGTNLQVSPAVPTVTGNWRTIGGTYRSGETNGMIIYSDGLAGGSTTVTGAIATNSNPVIIGNRAAADRPWPGKITYVSVWGRVLSASEMLSVHNELRLGSPQTLNWIKRRVVAQSVAAPAGNRRRRVLIGGAA